MPTKRNKSRLIALLAIATLTLGVMSPALAGPPDNVPPAHAETGKVDGESIGADKAAVAEEKAAFGAEKAAAGQLIAAERQSFATVTVQEFVSNFTDAVAVWTSCVDEAASSNEATDQEGINPLDECGPLNVAASPGNLISAITIS